MSQAAVRPLTVETFEGVPTRVATVRRIVQETPDTFTYWMTFRDPEDRRRHRFEAGQFNMLYVLGVGEVPISISSDPERSARLAHTIRSTGGVTNAIRQLRPGDQVGVRGPFGRGWPLRDARNGDLLIVAGGLGLAPVRPAIYQAIRHRGQFRRVIVLVGARGPEHMLYRHELDMWMQWMRFRAIEVHLTVDVPDDQWPYNEGVVSTLFPQARLDPEWTTAFVCGPEIMMRFAARDLLEMGLPQRSVYVSMERNMRCGMRICGHCQFGEKFVCADGPVFRYDEVVDLLGVDEL